MNEEKTSALREAYLTLSDAKDKLETLLEKFCYDDFERENIGLALNNVAGALTAVQLVEEQYVFISSVGLQPVADVLTTKTSTR